MYVFGGVTPSDPSYYPIAVFVGVFGQTAIVLAYKLATAYDLENMSIDFNVQIDGIETAMNDKQDVANLVTSVSSSSTDTQYPSAKLFYDTIGNVESLLAAI